MSTLHDESYTSCGLEDSDLATRLLRAGIPIFLCRCFISGIAEMAARIWKKIVNDCRKSCRQRTSVRYKA